MSLTHVGLFEGYGGTTMAAAAVLGELDTLYVSDIKPAAETLLEHHLPSVPNIGDFTVAFPKEGPAPGWARFLPRPDVATFSWPCQPHSSAGKRLGEKDPRALWPNVARFVADTRPAVLLGENVARIAGNGELRRVARTLADLGYVGAWRCVRASDVGAPHRRDRCFVVAVDPTADALGFVVRDEPGRGGGPDGAGAGIAGHDGAQREVRAADGVTLLPTPTQSMTTGAGTSGRDGGLNLQTAVTLLPTPTVTDSRGGRNATSGRTDPDSQHHSGWTLSDVAYAGRWGEYAEAIGGWERVLDRRAPEPTMISERTGKPQLAPAFVEWMMGVPAGHVTDVPGLTRNQQLSLLGDGVVPQQGAYAYRFLLDHLAGRLAAAEAA